MGTPRHNDVDESESGEFLATLAAEHTSDTTEFVRENRTLPPIVPLMTPYVDRGEVARGGMGSVRRAWDDDLGRHVAVKIISQKLMGDPVSLQRFVEESRISGQLDHPNIVPVHRLGMLPDGTPCLVMKLVEGRTFKAFLQALPPPPWPHATLDEVLHIFVKVCDAVSFAHARSVIHRDLKPENVMVGAFGEVYVMDWGIARVIQRDQVVTDASSDTPPGSRAPMGTPVYMAPEQALRLDAEINERTDVFLLGAMLYEILAGHPPHRGPNLVAILYRAITCNIVPPQDAAPERQAPLALCRIAMKALSRDPQERHGSAQELKADIERFLRGEDRAPTEVFPAGAKVIEEGQEGRAAYVIVSGRCVVYKVRDGERVVLREMGPGEVFGETAVFTARPCSATVEALTELTVKVMTRESVAESLGLDSWAGAFVRALAERFREVDDRLRALQHEESRRLSEIQGLRPPR